MKIKVNGEDHEIDMPGDVPLLWVIREEIGLLGTKFGCGKALCGACTVMVDGKARRSCVLPVASVEGAAITTVEGLGPDGALHAVQEAWLEENVVQCGYCQPGQIVQAAALLSQNESPTDEEIDSALSANLCRCGTYPRIRKAVHLAAQKLGGQK